jgi:hypothetical protein
MSDINLLLFGCGVIFIAAAGAYVYLRECLMAQEQPSDLQSPSQEPVKERLRKVA